MARRVAVAAVVLPFLAACNPAARVPPTAAASHSGRPAAEPSGADSANVHFLDRLDLSTVDQEWGTPGVDRSVDGNRLRIGGVQFTRGLGTHANSELLIDLQGSALRFEADVGVDDECAGRGSVEFLVETDDRIAHRSGVVRAGEAARHVSIDLTGVQRLALRVEDAGDGIDYDHANWADAVIRLRPGAEARPVVVVMEAAAGPDVAKFDPEELAIHPPRAVGATPGRPFLFRIPASGRGSLRFVAEGLPAGLELDAEAGIISGRLASAGQSDVRLSVHDRVAAAAATLTIVGGDDALALTPPMGWNSWNAWGTAVDEDKVRDAADWLVFSGLASRGYQYVNIDDAWEAWRGAGGRMETNEKFPDMAGLSAYVHGHGLKLGIYSSPGPRTCANYEGSFGFEYLDAEQFAAWGIDYLKHDWCSYGLLVGDEQPLSERTLRHPYEVMRGALDACGRDIVYSLCQYGMGDVATWGAEVGGNLWRTTGDITDSWSSMARIGFAQSELSAHAGPGRWNDPDMLVLGQVGWGPNLHPTRLTPHEQVTHMTLWSLLAAPLLIGCDLTQVDEFTLALLGNPEVIEIDQDPLGRAATRIRAENRCEVWARPLVNGDTAVGLFNRGRRAATVRVTWAQIGRPGPQRVRDVWRRADAGIHAHEFESEVAGHGAVFLRVAAPLSGGGGR